MYFAACRDMMVSATQIKGAGICMPTNDIVPCSKSGEFLQNPTAFAHDDLSELECLIVAIVSSQKSITISRLVLMVRDNPVIPRTFVDVKHIAQGVHDLDKLGYLKYEIREW